MSPDTSALSKSQMNSADSVCCIDTTSDSVHASTAVLPPTECDNIDVAEVIESSVIRSQCESIRPVDCYSGVDSEASSETSSNTVMSCDRVIACSD